jgi:hypothetical protein
MSGTCSGCREAALDRTTLCQSNDFRAAQVDATLIRPRSAVFQPFPPKESYKYWSVIDPVPLASCLVEPSASKRRNGAASTSIYPRSARHFRLSAVSRGARNARPFDAFDVRPFTVRLLNACPFARQGASTTSSDDWRQQKEHHTKRKCHNGSAHETVRWPHFET